jgi:hypothetical protein
MPLGMALSAVVALPILTKPVLGEASSTVVAASPSFSNSNSSGTLLSPNTITASSDFSSPRTVGSLSPSFKFDDHTVIEPPFLLSFQKEPIISPHSRRVEVVAGAGTATEINFESIESESTVRNRSHSSSEKSVQSVKTRSVGWKDPLFAVEFIPKEGRGQSVTEYRKQVALLRQRQKRSQEIADLRSFFSSTEKKEEPVQSTIPFSSAELELLDSIYPSSAPPPAAPLKTRTYDANTPLFTFKKLNYEPTVPVLPATSDPSVSTDEFALPKLQVMLSRTIPEPKKILVKPSEGKKDTRLVRSRSSSDAPVMTTPFPSPHPDLAIPEFSPNEEKKSESPMKFDYKLVSPDDKTRSAGMNKKSFRSSAPVLLERKPEPARNDDQSSGDPTLMVRRCMLARVPPYLRSQFHYGLLISSRK